MAEDEVEVAAMAASSDESNGASAGAGVRHRRCKSVTQAEQIVRHNEHIRQAQPDKPIHRPRDSLFSWSSKFTNFSGFVNWAFLMLTMGGLRLLLENLIKYGIRIDLLQLIKQMTSPEEQEASLHALWLCAYSSIPVAICYFVEKCLATEVISHGLGMAVQVVNLINTILLPMIAIYVWSLELSLVGSISICFLYAVLFLKLWSYVQVNFWCRNHLAVRKNGSRRQSISVASVAAGRQRVSIDGESHNQPRVPGASHVVKYPDNVKMGDLVYFLCAPTLCYELNFPTTTRIRKVFVLKRFLEVAVGIQVMVALFQQWIIPSVKNSLIPFSNMDIVKASERLLKLAIPNHLVWLIWFYLFFHSFLNLTGELLRFSDRNYYADWWNANNIDTFWRCWNMPAHRWAVRHLYLPIIAMGYPKELAGIAVFFISAFLHEYLISVPLKTFKVWVFMLMMWQIPLSYVSRIVEVRLGPRSGNWMVWAGLILGQPLCIMIYYHDYVIAHYGNSLLESCAQV